MKKIIIISVAVIIFVILIFQFSGTKVPDNSIKLENAVVPENYQVSYIEIIETQPSRPPSEYTIYRKGAKFKEYTKLSFYPGIAGGAPDYIPGISWEISEGMIIGQGGENYYFCEQDFGGGWLCEDEGKRTTLITSAEISKEFYKSERAGDFKQKVTPVASEKIAGIDARCFNIVTESPVTVAGGGRKEEKLCLHPEFDLILKGRDMIATELIFEKVTDDIFKLP